MLNNQIYAICELEIAYNSTLIVQAIQIPRKNLGKINHQLFKINGKLFRTGNNLKMIMILKLHFLKILPKEQLIEK